LNSDAEIYWGSGVGNFGGKEAMPVAMHGRSWSLNLTLPPLSTIMFRSPATAASP
jgi:1,4-alpha-glucan branching enzyme